MAYNLLEATRLMTNVCHVFVDKCIDGLQANKPRCEELIEQSLMMCTSLAPLIGYDAAAAIAKDAHATGKTVRQLVTDQIKSGKLKLTEAQLAEALDPKSMTMPSGKVLPVSA
jgi:fumarate hydratase class II